MGGDFNITRYSHEHSSRALVSPIMTEFNNFIASACLIDFSPNNCLYTWSNFQASSTMVKLDRLWFLRVGKHTFLGRFVLGRLELFLTISRFVWILNLLVGALSHLNFTNLGCAKRVLRILSIISLPVFHGR